MDRANVPHGLVGGNARGRARVARTRQEACCAGAHRLSTIRDADRIYVLDRGRVVETGTYDALLRAGGAFAALARRQLV